MSNLCVGDGVSIKNLASHGIRVSRVYLRPGVVVVADATDIVKPMMFYPQIAGSKFVGLSPGVSISIGGDDNNSSVEFSRVSLFCTLISS